MKVVVPDDFPPVYGDDPAALEPLRTRAEVQVFGSRAADGDELLRRLAGATAVINVRSFTVFR